MGGHYTKFMKFEEKGKEIKIFEKLEVNKYLVCGDFKRTEKSELCWAEQVCFRCEVILTKNGLDDPLYRFSLTKEESTAMWNANVLTKVVVKNHLYSRDLIKVI